MMNYEQFLLTKLAEEGSEVAQIALKTQQFGMFERHPDLSENNMQRCHSEIDDLMAVVELLNEKYGFGYVPNQEARERKKVKLEKYAQYSRSLGKIA